MIQAFQNRRLATLALLLLIVYGLLGWRLVHLQVVRHDEFVEEARKNTFRTELFAPRRGDIRDAKGNLLATSLPAKTVFADPAFIGNYQANIATAVAPLLGMTEWDLFHKLQPKVRTLTNELGQISQSTNRYVVLGRKVPLEQWRQIKSAMQNLKIGDEKQMNRKQRGFFRNLRKMAINADPVEDSLRVYPNGELAAHVLGYVTRREIKIHSRNSQETLGLEGIERSFNKLLTGTHGLRETEKDGRQREVATRRVLEVAPRDGQNVFLTIDARLQHLVEQKLAEVMERFNPKSATAILVRPQTGEVLALANLPTYDPNRPGDVPKGRADYRKNRAIMDVYEPGSTFKVVSVAAALDKGVVRWGERIWCEKGGWKWRRARRLGEYHGHAYEWMTVESILAKSSNIGTSKISVRMSADDFYGYLRGFGFGSKSKIALEGEQYGLVWKTSRWSDDDRTRIPIGQGIAVTPLQITMAVAAIANEGRLMRPMIVNRIEDADGRVLQQHRPTVVRQVISPLAARTTTKALNAVVSKTGTGRNAIMDFYSVAGKTGTADIPIKGVGYVHKKNLASFIGFLPASKPELVISVIVNEPAGGGTGGKCAAPCFREIAVKAANYLNLQPDLLGMDQPLVTRLRQGQNINVANR
jgi:cell division protein FtsI/penicillin-binding protein 2